MTSPLSQRISRTALLAVALLAAGCASTPPHARFSSQSASRAVMRPADTAAIAVAAAQGVVMADFEKSRVTERIQQKLAEKEALNAASAEPRSYAIDVTITRYEKGNAFARAMLAGLGQIHIDGDVKVYAMPAHDSLEEFTVQKTFAWGGVYGSSTSMEDIEQTFAESIANALTGQEEARHVASQSNRKGVEASNPEYAHSQATVTSRPEASRVH